MTEVERNIKEMMGAERDYHLGYEKSQHFDSDNYRNGYITKQINNRYGSMDISISQVEVWQNRPLGSVYPILFIDAIYYSIRDNGVICKLVVYVINTSGKKC